MNDVRGLQLLSTVDAEGFLTVELAEQNLPSPTGHEVLVRVEAAPINPSDLALLFGAADLDNARYERDRIVAQIPGGAMKAMAARAGQPMPVGNEGAGTVIAAGDAPEAQALMGKRVACIPGGMFAQYRIADARQCMALGEDVTAEQGASAFINPLTALGFVETMRQEGHGAIVHLAAASNLGQMLLRICQEDGIPLVNIVRREDQAALLKSLGADHVLNSASESFAKDLAAAIAATGATIAFDPIGGGKQAGQIFSAMEQAASRDAPYNLYGSESPKQVYIYGALDMSPTILNRSFGFSWNLGGWLLFTRLKKFGPEVVARMHERVRSNLATTFASHYQGSLSLHDMLTRDAVTGYRAMRTGEKYLLTPH
ncbi:MAG: zinc-binding dehydrogenase [Sphingobium sp.]